MYKSKNTNLINNNNNYIVEIINNNDNIYYNSENCKNYENINNRINKFENKNNSFKNFISNNNTYNISNINKTNFNSDLSLFTFKKEETIKENNKKTSLINEKRRSELNNFIKFSNKFLY